MLDFVEVLFKPLDPDRLCAKVAEVAQRAGGRG